MSNEGGLSEEKDGKNKTQILFRWGKEEQFSQTERNAYFRQNKEWQTKVQNYFLPIFCLLYSDLWYNNFVRYYLWTHAGLKRQIKHHGNLHIGRRIKLLIIWLKLDFKIRWNICFLYFITFIWIYYMIIWYIMCVCSYLCVLGMF